MAVRAVLDTNILADYLNGVEPARREIARHERPLISIVTWMEVLAGARKGDEEPLLIDFLSAFEVVELSRPVAAEAVALRRSHRVKLPDAIIWATARTEHALLVSRSTKDFPPDQPDVRCPYRL